MNKNKCLWCLGDDLYENYHDSEWGVPVYDDRVLFEFLILESMQAGLSWITILRKRQHYFDALDQFDVHKIAQYDQEKVSELLQNKGIIRHQLKIKSIITNAQLFIEVQKEYGSFSNFIWEYVGGSPLKNQFKNHSEVPAFTSLSQQISKDLKKKGFKFVGPTIVYAFMQATGMVNDHLINCFRYDQV
jgi:DNA-3-methyladenine glycosylase I